jgi:hypothetical protein
VDIDHFVLPVLHILLGLTNDVVRGIFSELQAGYESYTDAYVELEDELVMIKVIVESLKEKKAENERMCGNYTKYLKVRPSAIVHEMC